MSKFQRGYKPSPRDKVGTKSHGHMLSAAPLPPPSASLRDAVVSVLDQGMTSACVWHSTPQAIRIRMVKQGAVSPPLASRLFGYWNSRAANGDQNTDGGTYIHSAFDVIQAMGFCPESAWPFSEDPSIVNKQPPFESYRLATDQKLVGDYARIDSAGQQFIDDVKRAIAAGFPVVFGVDVDQPFEDLVPGQVWQGPNGVILGGHAICAIAYTPDYVEFVNSWGSSWCDGGFARMSYGAVQQWSDAWIVEAVPLEIA